uniref:SLC12A transporter C-terminal domain-containing protein n=1 Tax=Prymnesium polylepis TaxID=72548 RepID=A0A7S4HTF9_9EUKA
MTPDVDHGLTSLIQTAGLGGLAPNTVCVNWTTRKRVDEARARRMVKLFNEVNSYNLALMVLKGAHHVPKPDARLDQYIDIWWVVHDGGLQLLLSTILRKSKVWANCSMRVFCVIQAGEDPDKLEDKVNEFLYKMRIDATVKCVILTHRLQRPSSEKGDEDKGGVDKWAMNPAIVSTPIGNMLAGSNVADDEVDETRLDDVAGAAQQISREASPHSSRASKKESSFSSKKGSRRHSVAPELADLDLTAEMAVLDELNLSPEVDKSWRETFTATKQLNNLFLKNSTGCAILITNLPMPGVSSDETVGAMSSHVPYMMQVNMLTANVPLCLLVAGQKGSSVVTMYS